MTVFEQPAKPLLKAQKNAVRPLRAGFVR